MSVRLKADGKEITAYLMGDIDHHTAKEMREEIDCCLERNHPNMLVLDFRDVSFMDSSGIGILLNRYKEMKASGGKTCLYGAGPQVLRVLKIAGIPALMEMYDSEEAAFGGQGVEMP